MCRVAAAIAEPARARMLYCLMDNRARTSTELAIIADVSPSTGSAHLNRLKEERLVKVMAQGKHRYYSLQGVEVAELLEALTVFAGKPRNRFVSRVPETLVAARSCYDHIAGKLGVALHDRLLALGWLAPAGTNGNDAYELTPLGVKMLSKLGMDPAAARWMHRRFAYGCLDWSERRPHVGGAIGAALLHCALKKGWVNRELDSRALSITRRGKRELFAHFGVVL
ncbi:MAG: helix-turn-helix transcriptional regulator [Acidobacteriaceae bacterium]|nr:helix-turn-helix transcriptional regulator [Acidobacteriaceae bacterium]